MGIEEAAYFSSNFMRDDSVGIKTDKRIDNYLSMNVELDNFLKDYLSIHSWFKTKENVLRCFARGIYNSVFCENCGKELPVDFAKNGRRYCCKKCGCSDVAQKKRVETCLYKYGCETPLLNSSVKKKTVETCNNRYGRDCFAGSEKFLSVVKSKFCQSDVQERAIETKREKYGDNFGEVIYEKSKEKIIATNLERYGVEYPLQSEHIRSKSSKTMQERYGSLYFFGSSQNAELKHRAAFEKYLKNHSSYVLPLFSIDDYCGWEHEYQWQCTKCGKTFSQRIYITGLGDSRIIPRCPSCYPKVCSVGEKELFDYVRTLCGGKIIRNDRTVISPYELDIFLPDKRIAFEFNGVYWHQDNKKSAGYHLMKTKKCSEAGIRLIHVFEDEWLFKNDIVRSRIAHILGVFNEAIYARKCEVLEISGNEARMFLDKNHLQGGCNSEFQYGLFANGKLVSVMTFGKPRFNHNYDYELLRFATELEVRVVGGASKLLSFFSKNMKGKKIITYADRRYSDGNLYKKIGFTAEGFTSPNYWWSNGQIRLSRYQCQKHKLAKLLGDGFDNSISEKENMTRNGYFQIHDCGNAVFSLTI